MTKILIYLYFDECIQNIDSHRDGETTHRNYGGVVRDLDIQLFVVGDLAIVLKVTCYFN